MESNIEVLETARRAGMSIALDDFGAGYSSFSILGRLPLDKIRIDKSFGQRPGLKDRSDSILRASIRLANQLNFAGCIEGIETEEAAIKVASLGADEIQGYWIGKPQLVRESGLLFKCASLGKRRCEKPEPLSGAASLT
jgi:EAL domain-containing protein (putative c-di-GMP-specific phosphodiesterase class I)